MNTNMTRIRWFSKIIALEGLTLFLYCYIWCVMYLGVWLCVLSRCKWIDSAIYWLDWPPSPHPRAQNSLIKTSSPANIRVSDGSYLFSANMHISPDCCLLPIICKVVHATSHSLSGVNESPSHLQVHELRHQHSARGKPLTWPQTKKRGEGGGRMYTYILHPPLPLFTCKEGGSYNFYQNWKSQRKFIKFY